MTESEWKEQQKKKRITCYSHFDRKISLEHCWNEISVPQNVKTHSFYPFIHYTIKNRKVKKGVKQEPKKREIYYAAHKDGWIYRRYSFLLNELYNQRVVEDGIDQVAVAYRTNHEKKNNIDYALSAFEFILQCNTCHVMIGDFTKFFDNLDHSFLKERMCDLLGVKVLPPDYYAVFKNVTRFSYVEITELLDYHHLKNNKAGRKALNQMDRVLTTEQLHSFGASIKRNPNLKNGRGVPQGSPISAILANVYMLKTDKQINEYISMAGGFYMRYSDDFIMVIPDTSLEEFQEHCNTVKEFVFDAGGIELEDKKTNVFVYCDKMVKNCGVSMGSEKGKDIIEFLGFSFNGSKIRIRDKTISRYYNKAYRKARTITRNGGFTSKGTRASGKKLYNLYTIKGSQYYRKSRGEKVSNGFRERNFLDYVYSAKDKIKDRFVDTITPRHMQRIRKMLSKKKVKILTLK